MLCRFDFDTRQEGMITGDTWTNINLCVYISSLVSSPGWQARLEHRFHDHVKVLRSYIDFDEKKKMEKCSTVHAAN